MRIGGRFGVIEGQDVGQQGGCDALRILVGVIAKVFQGMCEYAYEI